MLQTATDCCGLSLDLVTALNCKTDRLTGRLIGVANTACLQTVTVS